MRYYVTIFHFRSVVPCRPQNIYRKDRHSSDLGWTEKERENVKVFSNVWLTMMESHTVSLYLGQTISRILKKQEPELNS